MSRKNISAMLVGILVGALSTIWIAPHLIAAQTREHSLFVYGTLQNNLLRYYACRCLLNQTPVTLHGYTKVGLTIVPAASSTVFGSLLSVSDIQLQRIDRYENTPDKYTRQTVRIDGRKHWVYIKND